MSEPTTGQPLIASRWVRVLDLAAYLSGILLLGIMLLVATAVFFRYFLHQPILGSQEIVQLGMVLVVMLAIPSTAAHDLHIRVDLLDKALGEGGRFFADLLGRVLGIVVLSLMVWRCVLKAFDTYEYADTTNMLALPLWPIYAVIAAGMGMYAVILLVEIIAPFKTRGLNHD
ncbi:TRAP transporter small permease [Thiothrix eikelboomii]|uniref:TRAP transporter small permease n=1 Tax=Thiothrix eikelboomii TaxID=92487 RepID=UPI003BAEA2FD